MQRPTTAVISLLVCAVTAGCSADHAVEPDNSLSPSQVSSRQESLADDLAGDDSDDSDSPYTIAVIGDTPYGAVKLAEFPSLVGKINADPAVRLVAHLGDIRPARIRSARPSTSR
jgi:hypothetical protein